MKTPMAQVHNENREKEKSYYFFFPGDFGLRSPVVHKNQLFETKNDTPIYRSVRPIQNLYTDYSRLSPKRDSSGRIEES